MRGRKRFGGHSIATPWRGPGSGPRRRVRASQAGVSARASPSAVDVDGCNPHLVRSPLRFRCDGHPSRPRDPGTWRWAFARAENPYPAEGARRPGFSPYLAISRLLHVRSPPAHLYLRALVGSRDMPHSYRLGGPPGVPRGRSGALRRGRPYGALALRRARLGFTEERGTLRTWEGERPACRPFVRSRCSRELRIVTALLPFPVRW